MWTKVKNFILDLLYPQFCFNCGKEGSYLCQDCQSILEILNTHQKHQTHPPAGGLKDLYFALPYQSLLIKNLIQKFKYRPFVKELAQPLTSLIITHFQLLDKKPNFSDFILIPVPLEKRKLKSRGFNQTEEIGKELSKFLKIPLLNNILAKIKETPPQVDLFDEERKENIKGVFTVRNGGLIKNRKILLVDDVYTTGSTLEECANVLKETGVKEIIGIVVARG
jgi:competence protein ComFC